MSDEDVRRAERTLLRHGLGMGAPSPLPKPERMRLIATDLTMEFLSYEQQRSGYVSSHDINMASINAWDVIERVEQNAPAQYAPGDS